MNEIWKDIKGYEGYYQVSNLGRVRSLPRIVDGRWGAYTVKGGILKGKLDKDGYIEYNFRRGSHRRYRRGHRIVLETFKPCDNMKDLESNHINGVKNDNTLDNLEWTTPSDNIIHSLYVLGNIDNLDKTGLNKPHRVKKIDINNNVIKVYDNMRECARIEGFSRSTLNKYSDNGDLYKGYYWKVIR